MSQIKVIKGNKVVRVTENELEKYLNKGYVIKDGGKLGNNTVAQPIPEKREYKSNPLYKTVPEIKVEMSETKAEPKVKVKEDTTKAKKTQTKSRSKK